MTISKESWVNYIDSLRKVNDKAANLMLEFMDLHRDADGLWNSIEARQAIIEYAYGISGKYGEAAAELTCEMYDTVGALSDVIIPAAVPAEVPTYADIAKAVNGVLKQTVDATMVASAVARQVKMVSVDTAMKNALRDGAQWAWIPHGDTCAFCLALAANGWQNASKKALKHGHAQHIHANCDCTYAVRFDTNTEVEGYNSDDYMEDFQKALDDQGIDENVESLHYQQMNSEALNALRRENYARNSERINAQKRSAYEKRKEREASSAEELNI